MAIGKKIVRKDDMESLSRKLQGRLNGITGNVNANALTPDQKAALAGTDGTPSSSNKYVTNTDSRNTNPRTPTSHAASHGAGGADALPVDAAAGTGSLRTIGTGALQGTAGNDARLSDSRTPTAHATTHGVGQSDVLNSADVTALAGLVEAMFGNGSTCTINNASVKSTASTIYTKVKETQINAAYVGSVTVKWQFKSGLAGKLAYTKLYINGAAIGTEWSDSSGSYVAEQDVPPANFSANDLVQIYAHGVSGGGSTSVENMQIVYGWEITAIAGATLVTPLPVTDTTLLNYTNNA